MNYAKKKRLYYIQKLHGQYGSVGVVTVLHVGLCYMLDVLRIVARFPAGTRDLCLHRNVQSSSGKYGALYSMETGVRRNFSQSNDAGT
jgi:hypothetical protein